MIKKVFPLFIAGMLGGIVTIVSFQLLNQTPAVQVNQPSPYTQQVNFSSNSNVNLDFRMAARKSMPTVVHITATESKDLANKRRQNQPQGLQDWFFGSPFDQPFQLKQGSGSGVIFSTDGYIVTNNHVVDFADEVQVTLSDNRQYTAEVIGKDPKSDLAVIKIEADGLPTLPFADSDAAEVGEWVLAVGNPFDLTSTVTAGIISAKGRDIDIMEKAGKDAIEAFIQTDAAVNPGNSGGALVNARGELLGINTAIATRTGSFQGYSFAIPVNIMIRIVNDIIEFGSYQRGYLGINISDLDNQSAEELGLSITQGVVVEGLADGGAAQFAGVLPKDVIVSLNGMDIKSAPELQEKVGRSKVGDVLTLTVNRRGEFQDIDVKLKGLN